MAITLTPVDDGRLEVYLDGETLFDRNAAGGAYPSLTEVRGMKKTARDRVSVAAT